MEYLAAAVLGALLRELYFYNKHQADYEVKSYWKDRFDDLLFGVGSAIPLGVWGGDLFNIMADYAIAEDINWLFIVGNSWHPVWAFVFGLMSSAIVGWVIESGWSSIVGRFKKKSE